MGASHKEQATHSAASQPQRDAINNITPIIKQEIARLASGGMRITIERYYDSDGLLVRYGSAGILYIGERAISMPLRFAKKFGFIYDYKKYSHPCKARLPISYLPNILSILDMIIKAIDEELVTKAKNRLKQRELRNERYAKYIAKRKATMLQEAAHALGYLLVELDGEPVNLDKIGEN